VAASVAAVLWASAALSAHRRDEYLQAARLAVAPDAVVIEIDLTPGMAIADEVINVIDRDRDGVFSPDEQQRYVSALLGAVGVDVDGRQLSPGVTRSVFPTDEAMREGEGMIRIQARAVTPALAAGTHRVHFTNRNDREASVYLANALVPESDSVAITAQRRNASQSELTIDFTLSRSPAAARLPDIGTSFGLLSLGVLMGWAFYVRRFRLPAGLG
jgi:hypothetical protein